MDIKVKDPSILFSVIYAFGENAQIDMALEEMSELTKALLKYRRYFGTAETSKRLEDVREEIADVYIMLAQLEIMFYSGPVFEEDKSLEDRIDQKLERLKNTIKHMSEQQED